MTPIRGVMGKATYRDDRLFLVVLVIDHQDFGRFTPLPAFVLRHLALLAVRTKWAPGVLPTNSSIASLASASSRAM